MRKTNMSVIPEKIVLVDKQGREWTRGPEYQDSSVNSPGWLQLQCNGVVMSWTDVHNLYGFLDDKGNRFLVVLSGYPQSV